MVGKKLIRNFIWVFLISSLSAQNYDKIEEINYLPDSLFYNGLDSLTNNGTIGGIVYIPSFGINPSLHFNIDTSYNYFDILSVSFFFPNDSTSNNNPPDSVGMTFLEQMPWYQNINQNWYWWTDPNSPWQNIPILSSVKDAPLADSTTLVINSSYSNTPWGEDEKWSWYDIELTNNLNLQDLTSKDIWIQIGPSNLIVFDDGSWTPDSSYYHNYYVGGEFDSSGVEIVGWGQQSHHLMAKIKIGYHDLPNSIEENPSTPQNFKLSQNFPNPFNPTTSINYEFETPNYEFGTLTIFNVLGEEVKSFILTKNSGKVVWDGKNNFGKSVSSGNYFYELKVGNQTLKKKMTLLK
ncbi:MAG: T9SS C-terminal target domain-containing protein [Calditrichaeota bacterium]|nr:MAG: T9SS C-terminal target domain-containing protein [Calditrichota bacterium]